MIGLKGNAPSTTQLAAPAAGGFFNQLKNDFSVLGDKIAAPYNAMTDEQKKRYQKFSDMASTAPPQGQFSPVQFGGGVNGGSLLSLVEEMKKRGF